MKRPLCSPQDNADQFAGKPCDPEHDLDTDTFEDEEEDE